MAHALDTIPMTDTEPEPAGSRWFLPAYAVAAAALSMALFTPIVVTMPLRIKELSANGAAGRLGLLLAVGAAVALVGSPLVGRLSDRTRSRFGRRRPWLVGGSAVAVLALAAAGAAPNFWTLLAAWCLAKLGLCATMAALLALLSDQVTTRRRGLVSGLIGICLVAGQVAGTQLVDLVSGRTVLMFALPAVVCLAAMLTLSTVLRDRPAPAAEPRGARPALFAVAGSFWVDPRRHPDFAWAWLSRFLFGLGLGTLMAYQAFFLVDRFGVDDADLPGLIATSVAVQSIAVVLASLTAGRLSDLLGRRRVFVAVSALGYAVGLVVVASAPSFPMFLVGMAVAGLGQGVYLSVELALVADVLPDRDHDAAKDLGVFNMAQAIPQSLAPALASVVLALAADSYAVLFGLAAVYAALGALAITAVRGVR